MTGPVQSRFLTLGEAAAVAGVTRHAVYVAVRRGELAAIKFGGRGQWRVERAVLEAWVRRTGGRRPSAC